ncbi:hypothetical protein N0V86_008799 [Didymella sp. IMI 355093]|nr:hypothetical protein N0V86_008799 [Didymella sp. IMI 355093]
MSHLLLPIDGPFVKISNLRHKPTELPRQLFYIIRGGTDAVESLELLLELCSESPNAKDTTTLDSSGYLAFDAHVGDTACQLRACMLLEVTKLLRRPELYTVVDTIRSTLCDLKKVTEAAKRLLVGLLELDWNRIRAGGLVALKVPKAGMTVSELLVTLGWSGVRRGRFLYNSRSASSSESLASHDSPSSKTSSVYDSDMSSSNSPTPGPGSGISDNEEINGVHWDPLDKQQVVRFVVYSYVLSKYKQLTSVGGVYRATLKPDLAFETGQKLVQQEFGRQFVRPNKRAVGEEFTDLQRYISELSCAWLGSQARKCWSLHPKYYSLLESTIRTSAKGVSSASSYLGYLVLRSLWAEESTPIIITTTRFCLLGIHRNYFKVTTHVERENDPSLQGSSVLPNISWQLSRLTNRNLKYLSQDLEPHIMVSGNSINGNAADYYSRLPSAHTHRDDQCCDNEKHCNDMLAADHDRIIQAIFAEHRHYAFELSGEEGVMSEDVVVQRLMDKGIPEMSTVWAKSKQEASELDEDQLTAWEIFYTY